MSDGYRWVLGNGTEIEAAIDPWLRGKPDFKVDQHVGYNIGHSVVSDFMYADSKTWDVSKVRGVFNEEDASLILSTRIPHTEVMTGLLGLKPLMVNIMSNVVTICGMNKMWNHQGLFNQIVGGKYGSYRCLTRLKSFFGDSIETTFQFGVD